MEIFKSNMEEIVEQYNNSLFAEKQRAINHFLDFAKETLIRIQQEEFEPEFDKSKIEKFKNFLESLESDKATLKGRSLETEILHKIRSAKSDVLSEITSLKTSVEYIDLLDEMYDEMDAVEGILFYYDPMMKY